MREVNARASQFREQAITLGIDFFGRGRHAPQAKHQGPMPFVHHPTTGQGLVFAVIDYRQIESARIFHRAPHHSGRGDRATVIRHGNDACILHLAHFGELSARRVFRDGADWKDVCTGGARGLLNDKASNRGIVINRVRIRHGADRREAAGDGCRGAAGNRFLVFVPRFAQMDVHVDEAGCDDQAGGVKDLDAVRNGVAMARTPDDAAILEQKVLTRIDPLRRINDVSIFDQQTHDASFDSHVWFFGCGREFRRRRARPSPRAQRLCPLQLCRRRFRPAGKARPS